MSVRTSDRRRNLRSAVSLPVAVIDRRGRVRLRGRTADISEGGLMLLTEARSGLQMRGRVLLEISMPTARASAGRESRTRRTVFAGRILRVEEIGQLVGLAIELLGPG